MCEKLLEFSYEMRSEFDREITRHDFRLMCLPRSGTCQKVVDVRWRVSPYTWLSSGQDGFGNSCIYGAASDHHSAFAVRVTGCVRTGLSEAEKPDRIPWELFLYQTPVTAPGAFVVRYYERLCSRELFSENNTAFAGSTGIKADRLGEFPQGQIGTSAPAFQVGQEENYALRRARYFMECLHRDFAYQSGATDTRTTSEQALEKGCGVCQDFAQLLITLCRMDGIAARYVAGMLLGEGETHAWAEIYSDGQWYALDPTHNCMADGRYIKLSHGRDCRDCLVNLGVYFNPAQETQTVRVSVRPASENGE